MTQRKESDTVRILSGVFEGQTLGTPISLSILNEDMRPGDYREVREKYRPSHADYTYVAKYGIRDWRGGGRTSARETAGRVAAGAIARKLLAHRYGVEIVAWVSKVGRLAVDCDGDKVTREQVEQTPIRCPDLAMAERMIAAVEAARKEGNSLGGVVSAVARGCPPGWGEPVFDRLEADLARAVMSLPASKGFEVGSGFAGTDLTGLEHNDEFYMEGDRVRTRTNRSGGVQGGISNGETDLLPRGVQAHRHGACANSGRSASSARTPRSRAAGATIPACCRARCRWWRRWPRWSSPIMRCATTRSARISLPRPDPPRQRRTA